MARILNSNLTWETLPGYGGLTSEQIRSAFWGRAAQKVLLQHGFPMYKMHNYATLAQNTSAETAVSPWWASYNPYEEDPGFNQRVKLGRLLRTSLREISRVYLAVGEHWNSFKYLAIVRLAQPVYGFYGTVSSQARLGAGQQSLRFGGEQAGSTRRLPGFGRQIYIPSLTVSHVEDVRIYLVTGIENGLIRLPRRL